MATDPAKQDLIRNAAIRVFARKGFHATRAEEIAEEAGIAVGTIYNYFESKAQILLSIFEREFDEEVGLYESLAKSGVSVRERFSKILSAHFARLAESRDLARSSCANATTGRAKSARPWRRCSARCSTRSRS